MSNTNSVVPFKNPSIKEIHEALGVLKISGGTDWYQVIAGLIIQGGLVSVGANLSGAVNFPIGFRTKVLGIFLQAVHGPVGAVNENSGCVDPSYSLSGFTLNNDGDNKVFFWWAIGI